MSDMHDSGHGGGQDGGHESDSPSPLSFSHEHEESGHGEPWLVSYADLMTLLFGFFVILYSIANARNKSDDGQMISIRKELAVYFGGKYISNTESAAEKIKSRVGVDPSLLKEVAIVADPDRIRVVIQSQFLFESGSAEFNPKATPMITSMVNTLKTSGSNLNIRVEGYTDDVPITPGGKYPTNWELSTARASSVVRVFEKEGFSPESLTAVGYGSAHAAFPNLDSRGVPIPENRALNRRVVIHGTPNLEAPPQIYGPAAEPATEKKSEH
ncbi:MAG: OmpA family protein [Methylotenera sp.]|nr:OmpA family protein [Oligoflexia bacterium]